MEKDRETKWLEDIEQLSKELPKKHKNVFSTLKKERFYEEIETFKKSITKLDNYELQVEIAKVVSLVRDAHTYVNMHIRYLCPYKLYYFNDGIYVTASLPQYKEMLGSKIIAINDIEIENIINDFSVILSYENEYYFKNILPKYLPAVELMYGLGIIDNIDILKITYRDKNNGVKHINMTPVLISELNKDTMNEVEGICDSRNLPLYRQHSELNYWFKYIEDSKIIYFKYNKCRDMQAKSVLQFTNELIEYIESNDVEKLIIDLRDNSGGNSTLLDSFIKYISSCRKINKSGNLFIIIGRETFSSALLNALSIKRKTNALFVGEPTGGKPNCYGEVESFTLHNYGLTVFYSTQYYDVIGDDSIMSLYPDIEVQVSMEDYKSFIDPVFEYIKYNELLI